MITRPEPGRRGPLRPWLGNTMRLEDELEALGVVPPFKDDPRWLALPLARRDKALRRALAMHGYDGEPEPGLRTIKPVAQALGMSVRQVYDLRTRWEADGRTIFTMVPGAGRPVVRNPKLDPDVQAALTEAVAGAAAKLASRTPRAMLAQVLEDWPRDRFAPPTEQTIRSYVAAHLQGGVGEGPFSLNVSSAPQEDAEHAERHGEVLVIDHVSPEIFVEEPRAEAKDRPRGREEEGADPATVLARPTLTLAIDLATATVLGFAMDVAPPHAGLVTDALRDAEQRTATAASAPGTIKPRLVLATTSGPDWRALVRTLSDADVTAAIRWTPRLHHGGPTRRLIGKRLGDLPLWARKSHARDQGASEFDPERHPLVTLDQARAIVADAIARHARERMPTGMATHAVRIWPG